MLPIYFIHSLILVGYLFVYLIAYSHLLHIKRDGFISEKSFYMSAGHHFRSRQRVHLRIIYEHDGVAKR